MADNFDRQYVEAEVELERQLTLAYQSSQNIQRQIRRQEKRKPDSHKSDSEPNSAAPEPKLPPKVNGAYVHKGDCDCDWCGGDGPPGFANRYAKTRESA